MQEKGGSNKHVQSFKKNCHFCRKTSTFLTIGNFKNFAQKTSNRFLLKPIITDFKNFFGTFLTIIFYFGRNVRFLMTSDDLREYPMTSFDHILDLG